MIVLKEIEFTQYLNKKKMSLVWFLHRNFFVTTVNTLHTSWVFNPSHFTNIQFYLFFVFFFSNTFANATELLLSDTRNGTRKQNYYSRLKDNFRWYGGNVAAIIIQNIIMLNVVMSVAWKKWISHWIWVIAFLKNY